MISRTLARFIVRVCTVLAFLKFSGPLLAQTLVGSLTLAWDPSPDPSVVGYRLYEGNESLVYTNVINIGNGTTATIVGLIEGATYYFAVTAYDANGVESSFSGEIGYTVPVRVRVPFGNVFISTAADGTLLISGTGTTGDVYNVLATADFKSWQIVGTINVGTDGSFQFNDSSRLTSPRRFFRLQRVLNPALAPKPVPILDSAL